MEPSAGAAKTAQIPDDLTGATVGRFLIRARLGAGAMGEVYRAEDSVLKRTVALKRIAPSLQADPYYRDRFFKEAERASSLAHSKIAGIFDVLEDPRGTFLVMEYVEGQTLRQRMAQPMSVEEFLPIARQCGEALSAAHEKRIVHCDIKPENIILTPNGDLKVLDFGVAKKLPDASDITSADSLEQTRLSVGGTFLYMAPEVMLDRAIDTRSDLFSLGVVFYEALSGRHPFKGGILAATTNRILYENPAPLHKVAKNVPAELSQIVHRMLEKNPAARYQSAAELLEQLHAFQHGQSLAETTDLQVGVRALPHDESGGVRWFDFVRLLAQNHPRWAIFLALTLVASVASALYFSTRRPPVVSERDRVLVADFENRTGEPLFDQTVTELVKSALVQSRYLNVVSREQVREAAKRAGLKQAPVINRALGTEMCKRENYRALLTGRMEAASTGYQLHIEVVDPWQDVSILIDNERFASASDVFGGVDRLTRRLRKQLGESISQIGRMSKPLAQVTTASLPALQRYTQALDLNDAGDTEGFRSLMSSALDLDPDFAMAHLALARNYYFGRNDQIAAQHLNRARRHLDDLSEREQHLILATEYSVRGEFEKAADQFRLLTEIYPDDLDAQRFLADASLWTGRTQDAIGSLKQVLRLAPLSASDHATYVRYLTRVNAFQDSLQAYQKAMQLGLDSPGLHWGAGLAQLGMGNLAAARREFETVRAVGGTFGNLGQLYLLRVLLYEGRLHEAEKELRTGMLLDQKVGTEVWVPLRRYLLARVLLLRGRKEEALKEVQMLWRSSDEGPAAAENLRRAGVLACELGDLRSARKLLALLDRRIAERESNYNRGAYYHLKGSVELAEGRPGEAVQSLQASATFFPSFDAYWNLAEALMQQGDFAEAAEAYRKFLDYKGELFHDDSPTSWVVAHLRLARVQLRAGDETLAKKNYDEFLRLWTLADSDIPLLQEARKERKRLP